MAERTRTYSPPDESTTPPELDEVSIGFDDDVTDEDIEAFLNQPAEVEGRQGFFNLPTIAGLATIGVGAAYLLQRYDLLTTGFEIGSIVGPWLVGVLIILLGFVFLSWKPRRAQQTAAARRRAAERRARQRRERPATPADRAAAERVEPSSTSRTASGRKHFARSRSNRKIAGVCGGIGEYFGVDPTIVRIAFVIALIAGQGMALPLYLVLAFVMPKPEAPRLREDRPGTMDDERVIIIRS